MHYCSFQYSLKIRRDRERDRHRLRERERERERNKLNDTGHDMDIRVMGKWKLLSSAVNEMQWMKEEKPQYPNKLQSTSQIQIPIIVFTQQEIALTRKDAKKSPKVASLLFRILLNRLVISDHVRLSLSDQIKSIVRAVAVVRWRANCGH